jgi:hypothetical protein
MRSRNQITTDLNQVIIFNTRDKSNSKINVYVKRGELYCFFILCTKNKRMLIIKSSHVYQTSLTKLIN